MSSDDGKKVYTSCIKKLKSELNGAKSYCVDEIQQLFPLSQRMFTVTTVKPPSSVTKGQVSSERIHVSETTAMTGLRFTHFCKMFP